MILSTDIRGIYGGTLDVLTEESSGYCAPQRRVLGCELDVETETLSLEDSERGRRSVEGPSGISR